MEPQRGKPSLIRIADEQVSILAVCQAVGMAVGDIDTQVKSIKVNCPFGRVYHTDGGYEDAFRIYPEPNNAFCFACQMFFSPVSLYAKAHDISMQDAASSLLEQIGYKPKDLDDRWNELDVRIVPPNTAALAEALKIYCSSLVEDWELAQFEPSTARVLAQCLELLPRIEDETGAEAWLSTTKLVMSQHLRKEAPKWV